MQIVCAGLDTLTDHWVAVPSMVCTWRSATVHEKHHLAWTGDTNGGARRTSNDVESGLGENAFLAQKNVQRSGFGPSTIRVFSLDPIGGHVGGHCSNMLSFHRALVDHNVDVTWVTCDETRQDDGYDLWTPFRGIYGGDSLWRRGLRYSRGLWMLLQRARREAEQRPVVIHQQFVTIPLLELAFVFAARRLHVPCVLTPHDVIPYADVSRTGGTLPLLYRQYDALTVHTEAARKELEAIVGQASSRVYLIPHGHLNDCHGDAPYMEQVEARQRLGLSTDRSIILFFGQIKPEKGLQHLLRAMPQVLQSIPDALLMVAGRPWHNDITTYQALIEDLSIGDHVRARWEYIPDEELPLYYRAADVVALPYTRAYQSGVCLTAYAFRRPVVASAVGGLQEQVLDGQTGYLVPPADPAAWAEALAKILQSRSQAEAKGERGQAWAARAGDWNTIADQTIEVYHKVCRLGRH